MTLRADILRPADLSARDREAWAALRASDEAFANPLFSWEFAELVGRVRADARVALFRRGETLVGVLAHHRRPGGSARPIGAPFSDYHALITGPAPGMSAADALAAARLRAYAYSALVDPHGLFGAPEGEDATHRIALTGSPEAFLEDRRSRSPKAFKNWRRLEHKAEREIGALRMTVDPEPAVFEQVLTWKRRQLAETGRHDFLASGSWTDSLMRAVFTSGEGRVTGMLLTLWAGDTLAGAYFGLREAEVFHPWLASINPDLRAYSPGQAFLSQAIRAMPEFGLRVVDLGAGHGHYKEPFASEQGRVGQGVARASGARASAAERLAGIAVRTLAPPERAASIRRRLDHIAQVELSLGGRVAGVARALAAKGLGGGEEHAA